MQKVELERKMVASPSTTSFYHALLSSQRHCVSLRCCLVQEQDLLSYVFIQYAVFVEILILCDFVRTNSEVQQSDSIETPGSRL